MCVSFAGITLTEKVSQAAKRTLFTHKTQRSSPRVVGVYTKRPQQKIWHKDPWCGSYEGNKSTVHQRWKDHIKHLKHASRMCIPVCRCRSTGYRSIRNAPKVDPEQRFWLNRSLRSFARPKAKMLLPVRLKGGDYYYFRERLYFPLEVIFFLYESVWS